MDNKDILDAPENDDAPLVITWKSVLLGVLAFIILYPLYFFIDLQFGFSSVGFSLWKFNLDVSKVIFIFINCLGLYIFMAFIKFELQHWFRVMTISIFIILIAIIVGVFFILKMDGAIEEFAYSDEWKSIMYRILKAVSFISVIIGGGTSLAVQFLHKKNYLVFSAIIICTIAVFSLIEYL